MHNNDNIIGIIIITILILVSRKDKAITVEKETSAC